MSQLDEKKKQARANAIQWAHETLKRDFVVLDTETTGLPAAGGEVVQLGIVNSDGKTVMNQLVKPKGVVHPKAEAVHGLTADVLKDAPSFSEVFSEILSILDGKLIVAYNAGFDHPIMDNTCKKFGLPMLTNEWSCAMLWYAKFHGEYNMSRNQWRWKKLTEAAEHFKIKTEGAHDALADVVMTVNVIKAMAATWEVT